MSDEEQKLTVELYNKLLELGEGDEPSEEYELCKYTTGVNLSFQDFRKLKLFQSAWWGTIISR